ncbi:hypothetical protein W823_07050 [Williamsia sp. D3]|nr:hypothetical protein W823_07050 [Williamsia sp. D3]
MLNPAAADRLLVGGRGARGGSYAVLVVAVLRNSAPPRLHVRPVIVMVAMATRSHLMIRYEPIAPNGP